MGMLSFVGKDSLFPFLGFNFFSSVDVQMSKYSIFDPFYKGTHYSDLIFWSQLYEFSFFEVIDPSSFVSLSFGFYFIATWAIFFIVLPNSFKGISITIGSFTLSTHFVIYELSFVGFVVSGNFHLAFPFPLILHKVPFVKVSVSVVDDSIAVETSILKSTFIGFIFQSKSTFAVLFIVFELSLVNSSSRFNQNSFSVFLAHYEVSCIFSIFIEHPQLTFAMELVVEKLPFILDLSLESIDPISMFFSIFEFTIV